MNFKIQLHNSQRKYHWNFNEKYIESFDQIGGENVILNHIEFFPSKNGIWLLIYSSLIAFDEILVFYREVF